MSQTGLLGARLCGLEPPPKRLRLDVIGACALAVDLDDGDQLAVAGLQPCVSVDLDLLELEPQLGAKLPQLLLGSLAEMAADRLVEDDPRAGSTGRGHA